MASVSSSTDPFAPSHKPVVGQPAWDVALLWPPQGSWSELDYLSLTEGSNHLVELTDGQIEVLEMPVPSHQRIQMYLYAQLLSLVSSKSLGELLPAPLRIRIGANKFREPDLVFLSQKNRSKAGEEYFEGADLVVEVVSKDAESRKRDLIQKRVEYAQAGIPEYWIVDPEEKKITVLTLQGENYTEHGVFTEGQSASSKLLDGFTVEVQAVFAAAKG